MERTLRLLLGLEALRASPLF